MEKAIANLVKAIEIVKLYRTVSYISKTLEIEPSDLEILSKGIGYDESIALSLHKEVEEAFSLELLLNGDEEKEEAAIREVQQSIMQIIAEESEEKVLSLLGNVTVRTLRKYERGEVSRKVLVPLLQELRNYRETIDTNNSNTSNETKPINQQLNNHPETNIEKPTSQPKVDTPKLKSISVPELEVEAKSINDLLEENVVMDDEEILDNLVNTKTKKEPIHSSKEKITKEVSVKSKEREDSKRTMTNLNTNKNIIELLFKGVEEELKASLGENVEIKKVEMTSEKVLLEIGIED